MGLIRNCDKIYQQHLTNQQNGQSHSFNTSVVPLVKCRHINTQQKYTQRNRHGTKLITLTNRTPESVLWVFRTYWSWANSLISWKRHCGWCCTTRGKAFVLGAQPVWRPAAEARWLEWWRDAGEVGEGFGGGVVQSQSNPWLKSMQTKDKLLR